MILFTLSIFKLYSPYFLPGLTPAPYFQIQNPSFFNVCVFSPFNLDRTGGGGEGGQVLDQYLGMGEPLGL